MNALEQRLKKVLEQVGLSPAPESPADLLVDFGLDSLMMVLIVAGLEKEFGIKVPAATVTEERFTSIATLAAWIQELGVA